MLASLLTPKLKEGVGNISLRFADSCRVSHARCSLRVELKDAVNRNTKHGMTLFK